MKLNNKIICKVIAYSLLLNILLQGCYASTIDSTGVKTINSGSSKTIPNTVGSQNQHQNVLDTEHDADAILSDQITQLESLQAGQQINSALDIHSDGENIVTNLSINQNQSHITTTKSKKKRNRKRQQAQLKKSGELEDLSKQLILKQQLNSDQENNNEIVHQKQALTLLKQSNIVDSKPSVCLVDKSQLEAVSYGPGKQREINIKRDSSTVSHTDNLDIIAAPIAHQATYFKPNNTASLASTIEYFQNLFSRINTLEEYNKLKKMVYSTIEKNYSNYTFDERITIFNELCTHIYNVLQSKYVNDINQEDKVRLVNSFYSLNFEIADDYLAKIVDLVRGQAENNPQLWEYNKNYRQAKEKLKMYFGIPKRLLTTNYLEKINCIYESYMKQFTSFAVYSRKLQFPHKKVVERKALISTRGFKKIEVRQQENVQTLFNTKQADLASIDLPRNNLIALLHKLGEEVRNVSEFLAKYHSQYTEKFEELAKQFLELEQLAFSTSELNVNCRTKNPTAEDLIKLYESIYQPAPNSFNLDIYPILKLGIMILLISTKFEDVLIRLDAMDAFYACKQQPKDLQIIQAIAYAACGNYERLTALKDLKNQVKQKVLARKAKIKEKEKKNIEIIKAYLDSRSSFPEPVLKQEPFKRVDVIKSEALATTEQTNQPISALAYQEEIRIHQEEVEARSKRHQEAEEQRRYKELNIERVEVSTKNKLEATVSVEQEPPISQILPDIYFLLPRRAFNTISKIFQNNWKITRPDIENLFEFLGQNIDISTKSSHHIIKISQGIVLVREEQIIGMVTDLAAAAAGHLTLPNWDKEVPFYMRSQIMNLLRIIGINKGNCSKGNREENTQIIPMKSN